MATPPVFVNATALDASSLNAIGLWLVKTQTVGSAVSSVTVTNAFSADFDNYRVIYDGGTASANTSLSLRIGAATTGYQYALVYQQYNATTPLGTGSTTGLSFVESGRTSTVKNSLNVELFGPYLTTYTGFRSLSTDYLATSGYVVSGAGFLNNTTSYTDLVMFPQTGTITGGTIRIYGYRN